VSILEYCYTLTYTHEAMASKIANILSTSLEDRKKFELKQLIS
jgi:hypothetical protein